MSEVEELELTELEIAKLKANNEALINLRRQLQEIQKKVMQHQKAQKDLSMQILERAGINREDAAALENWNMSKINFQEFKGIAQIPINGEEPEKAQPRSQKEE